ncbi:hypothetical protein TcG_07985 [Trypanosoma cruzi]|nr:hypothetical protein TcG_07985 [Trypanosoma cruzi]
MVKYNSQRQKVHTERTRPLPAVMAHCAHKLRDGLHTTNARTASSHPPMGEEKRHIATVSSSVPRTTGYGHSPAANTTHTEQAFTQRATRGSGSSSIHDVATKFPAVTPTLGFGAQLK